MRSIARPAASSALGAPLLLLPALLIPHAVQAATVTIQPIYFFPSDRSMGITPRGGVVADAAGRLYGTTSTGGASNSGTVWQLTPPTAGQSQWTALSLHDFNPTVDGYGPGGGLTLDAEGNVYGTSQGPDGICGNVFKLSNTTNWPITALHQFLCATGGAGEPEGNLVFGPGDLLYGSTNFEGFTSPADAGVDFSVSPAGNKTEYSQIAGFAQAGDGLGPTGLASIPGTPNLVGTTDTAKDSTLYALETKTAGAGTIVLVHNFGRAGDVNGTALPPIVGYGALQGSAFGCASGGGSGGSGYTSAGGIYKESDSNGRIAESVVFNFPDSTYPYANGGGQGCFLIQGSSTGTIYGITQTEISEYTNAFFQLTPPTQKGGAWSEQVLSYFNTSGALEPQYPMAKIGNNYYIAFQASDGTNNGDGVVMQITVTP